MATIAEDTGLLSARYEEEEVDHLTSVGASNTHLKSDDLRFQLKNPHAEGPNAWTFNYGTMSTNDWNYHFEDISSGHPYTLSQSGVFSSGITSVDAFSDIVEFNNLRMDYQPINFNGNSIITTANLSQFATGQDFENPDLYQYLYSTVEHHRYRSMA